MFQTAKCLPAAVLVVLGLAASARSEWINDPLHRVAPDFSTIKIKSEKKPLKLAPDFQVIIDGVKQADPKTALQSLVGKRVDLTPSTEEPITTITFPSKKK